MNAQPAHVVLRARAAALARIPEPPPLGRTLHLLEFTLGAATYAVETAHVEQVMQLSQLTAVPGAPAHVIGAINVRGRIVAVLDLRSLLQLPAPRPVDLDHLVLLRCASLQFAVLAQTIAGIREHVADTLGPPVAAAVGCAADLLDGITPDGAMVLNIPRIARDPRLQTRASASPTMPPAGAIPSTPVPPANP